MGITEWSRFSDDLVFDTSDPNHRAMEDDRGFLAQTAAAASQWNPHMSRASILRLMRLARLDERVIADYAEYGSDEVVEVNAGTIMQMIRLARGTR